MSGERVLLVWCWEDEGSQEVGMDLYSVDCTVKDTDQVKMCQPIGAPPRLPGMVFCSMWDIVFYVPGINSMLIIIVVSSYLGNIIGIWCGHNFEHY